MNKIAIYKEAMEKIAARAWKKFLPKLSDTNYKRLVDAGIYNKNKELQGLRRGTHNILKQNDAKMIRKPNQAGAASVEMFNDYSKKSLGEPLSLSDRKDLMQSPKDMGAFSASSSLISPNRNKPINSINGKTGGFTFVPKNENNKNLRANPNYQEVTGLQPISRRDRDARKWTQAITERHEADELRYSKTNARKGIADATRYYSHVSPKVLMQESANVGMMPREVKNNAYMNLRRVSGEASNLQGLSGVPYGSSAVYDKKAARRAEQKLIRNNGDRYGTL